LGIPYRPNPRFAIGKRRIISHDAINSRNGQEAWYWSLSL